jgi:hypothetical protein
MTIQDSGLAEPSKAPLMKAIVLIGLALVLVTVFVSILFIPRESPSPSFSPSNSQAISNTTLSPEVTTSSLANTPIFSSRNLIIAVMRNLN